MAMMNVGPDLANKGLLDHNKARSKPLSLSLMKMFFIAKPWPPSLEVMLRTCSTQFKQDDEDPGLAHKISIDLPKPSCDNSGAPS